jgi:hypothetical protein
MLSYEDCTEALKERNDSAATGYPLWNRADEIAPDGSKVPGSTPRDNCPCRTNTFLYKKMEEQMPLDISEGRRCVGASYLISRPGTSLRPEQKP